MINNKSLALELEEFAIQLAHGAGKILANHFGRQLTITYKDKGKRDPVTSADTACQNYLKYNISRRFPDHGILAEEDSEESTKKVPDILWVLDPLDGTTNFLNGLPIYASSIAVLHRGIPIAGALYLPWPNPIGGFVLHSRRGGGCFANNEPVAVYDSKEPSANRLVGLPGSYTRSSRFSRRLPTNAGEIRTTGSIAYELAMTACGVIQYSVFDAPKIWDIAAGALAVIEANGSAMTRFSKQSPLRPLESLFPSWADKSPTFKELRSWRATVVAGNRQVTAIIASNLHRPPRFTAMQNWLSHHIKPKSKLSSGDTQ
jgi:myo-inositol-1(or 4)-monophosphatase